MSLAVVSTLWIQIFSPEGILNSILGNFGIDPQPFINSSSQALPSIAIMSSWQGIGYQMIIFLGSPQMNFYDITVRGDEITFTDGSTITLPKAIAEKLSDHQGELILGIRGEDIKLDSQSIDAYDSSKQQAVIDNTEIMGNENNLYFQFSGTQTVARVSKYEVCQIGDKVEFVFMPHKMHFFDKETEKAI